MSQVQSFVSSMGPAGPILTLTGDSGGAVGPTGGNINILGEDNAADSGFATVDGDAGSSTLSILPLQDTVTTADATATAFALTSFIIPVNTSIVMTANVIGNKDDYSAACGGIATGCARRAAGAAVFVGNNTLQSEDSGTGTPEFGIQLTGNTVQVYAQGIVAETWDWTCTFQYQVQLL